MNSDIFKNGSDFNDNSLNFNKEAQEHFMMMGSNGQKNDFSNTKMNSSGFIKPNNFGNS